MTEVKFYDAVKDELLKFAVIAARYEGKWVLCKHTDRDTYEFPGGRREDGEDIETTARRELYEETGALEYTLTPVCVYSVVRNNEEGIQESFGFLYYAEIKTLGSLPQFEIERIELMYTLPEKWTYPEIQPRLSEKVLAEMPNR